MEIDTTCRCGPLSEEEKLHRRANRLCLYCGGPGHIALNCPHRPRRQVNQIVSSTKAEAISLEVSNSPNISQAYQTNLKSTRRRVKRLSPAKIGVVW